VARKPTTKPSKPTKPTKPTKPGLDRGLVVRTALRVLDEIGLDRLTLRSIATELGVQPPALYWHFRNKQELLDEMATTVMADAVDDLVPPAADDWREWMAATGRGLRRVLLRHRDGAKMLSGTYLTDDRMFSAMEDALGRMTGAGLSLRDAVIGLNVVYSFTVGFVIEEQAVHPRPGERDERYGLANRDARVDADRFPLARAAGEVLFTDFDERFERSLEMVVAGVAAVATPV
jgi:AcrR family transcriptional regulator